MYAKKADGPRSMATEPSADSDPIENNSANFRALITTTGSSMNDCGQPHEVPRSVSVNQISCGCQQPILPARSRLRRAQRGARTRGYALFGRVTGSTRLSVRPFHQTTQQSILKTLLLRRRARLWADHPLRRATGISGCPSPHPGPRRPPRLPTWLQACSVHC